MSKLSRFINLPPLEKKLFFGVLIRLYLIKLLLVFISFKKATNWYRMKGKDTEPDPSYLNSLKRSIDRASKFTFWSNKCLVNTLCARHYLNKRNYISKAFLGIRKNANSSELEAHAWISAGNDFIVASEADYEILYEF